MVTSQPINFGQPSHHEVVGRTMTLTAIRRAIERGSSITLTGERRIGKSWVLKALESEPPPGWTAIYTDVEQITDLGALHRVLVERITQRLPKTRRLIERIQRSGIKEVKGVPIPQAPTVEPVDQLRRLIRGLASDDRRLILILDELPLLAQRLEATRPGEALTLLQLLRALRNEEPNLRLVLAGSIGFHHLLARQTEIKAAVNDLLTIPIGPLGGPEARQLAVNLLTGIGRHDIDDEVLDAIVEATDAVPFYIQHLVAGVEERFAQPTIDEVAAIRRDALSSGDDPWRMHHYDERLREYFGPNEAIARAMLTAIAASDDGVPVTELHQRVIVDPAATRTGTPDEATVRQVLDRLRLDHYVDTDSVSRRVSFYLKVVRDAWRSMYL